MTAQLSQYLPWIGLAVLAVFVFFPRAVPKIQAQAGKPLNAGRSLIEQAQEIGLDDAGNRLQEALGQYHAAEFFNKLQGAMAMSPAVPTPTAPPQPAPPQVPPPQS